MSLATIGEVDLRAELWLSFLGVLKAYAAIAHPDEEPSVIRNLDDSPDAVLWSALCREGRKRCVLSVHYDPKKGKGYWRIDAEDEPRHRRKPDLEAIRKSMRPFSLNPDGSVDLDGSVVDMDHAAIQLLGWFANTLKTAKVEVPA